MRCPLQGNLQFPRRCPAWYAVPRWGKLNNGISIPRPCPNEHRVLTCRRGSVEANPATTFSFPCPNGASHTGPGCQPWESPGKGNPRSEGTPPILRVAEIGPALHSSRCLRISRIGRPSTLRSASTARPLSTRTSAMIPPSVRMLSANHRSASGASFSLR